MAKCPLCGSDGDDLVFRFYCSNKECDNWTPPKGETPNQNGDIMPFRIKEVRRKPMTAPKSEIFHLSPPEFVGSFPIRKDAQIAPKGLELCREVGNPVVRMGDEVEYMRRRIMEALRVPKGFLEPDHNPGYGSRLHELLDAPPLPRFDLVMEPSDRSLFLVWYDDVPEALNLFVDPIMRRRVGEPMRATARATTREEILQCLARMRAKGELVWNRCAKRWELHFTE